MSGLSELEQYLLDEIRAGRSEGWSQLVDRYQGRLLAFACSQTKQRADAEDVVQETFIRFLRGLHNFRGQSSLESYLFAILRRALIDQFRGRRVDVFAIMGDTVTAAPSADMSASWHASKEELASGLEDRLGEALRALSEDLRQRRDFTQLQMVELLFAAQMSNQAIAKLLDVPASRVNVVKHRWIKRLAARMEDASARDVALHDVLFREGALLTEAWQSQRPTCPKRSTIGQYILGALDAPWRNYVHFHLQTLGCRFCCANRDDIESQAAAAEPDKDWHQRLMQSTVGFLKRT